MWPRPTIVADKVFLILLCALLSGCSRSRSSVPAITFTKVPAAAPGGPDKLDTIAGRATTTRPDQQIVLYARSEDLWWVQPFTNRPYTKIQSDSSWKSQTHLGTEYAALLVDPQYSPPDTTEVLPGPGAGIAAVAVMKGQGPPPAVAAPKTLSFSGYEWAVRSGASFRGGSGNSFDPANAWTDGSGALHLRITKVQDAWKSAEVKLTRSLGYGTYAFVVHDVSHLEPSGVLALLTWDGAGTEQNRRELDIELSRWGNDDINNADYVVQPYYIPSNMFRFRVPAGVFTHAFHWEPGQVTFSTTAGSGGGGAHALTQHVFTSGAPSPGGDLVRISLYPFGKGKIPLKNETEIVIDKFEYLP